MIKGYIEEPRGETGKRKAELEKTYHQFLEQEKELKLKIYKIREESRANFDLFSPRSFERMSQTNVYDLEEELKNIVLKKQDVKRQIREKEKMMQKIEQMEQEIRGNEPGEWEETIELPKEKVGDIVKTLDECLRLMYNDRSTCKAELKQIKMYLKAFVRK